MDVAEGITFLGVELVLIALMLLPVFQSNLFIAIMTSTAIGLAHGIGRALGILRNHRQQGDECAPLLILGTQWRWRMLDGLALLLLAGVFAADALTLLSRRL